MGIGIAGLLILTRKAPARSEREKIAPLVKVQQVYLQSIQMIITGYGTVQPKVQAEVVPQVSGKVIDINPNFKNGGFIKAGQALITIDPRDYELALQRAEAEVARADVELDLEKAEAQVSRQEWEQLNPGRQPSSSLVFREPQIRQVQTRLQAARAELAIAALNLERTRVSLPFHGRVVSETVDSGQYVGAGQSIGRVYGIEAVEIEVPLEDEELAWFDVPENSVSIEDVGSLPKGSEAQVRTRFAGADHTWHGRIVRSTGEIDKSSRLVSIVVEVAEPFKNSDGRPALVPGMFVEVLIKGKMLDAVIPVPRYAVHNRNEVWIVEQGQLQIRLLEIARVDNDFAYATAGVGDGDMIVTSSMDVASEGMELRIQGQTNTQSDKIEER